MTSPDVSPVDLAALGTELLDAARSAPARRAARSVHAGELLRQTVLALLDGTALGEHESPPEATLQMLRGRVVLVGDGREWDLVAGTLIGIPPERHAVRAIEDSVFLLTVRHEAPASGTIADTTRTGAER
ncbi:LuxR family transcriptional regulator [Pseudoclavibacter chungangensis]|uniref:LuxR family transcriptional regulator n=1 Tax=Pseudoclavibacter chungangensis TaxID=587635 RepID=A0A7J5BSZ3_9MICO|nr:cupin domain-containing protein [Pseudoclavibacter chungangensis]KAB1657342.1 LuxR family transcriptional regulator [Pseudoclavibacter chungangensis]NYJ66201.1 quercetin dioxygenase-like cupin family protein [Pseudoclavibacter chungangensis]